MLHNSMMTTLTASVVALEGLGGQRAGHVATNVPSVEKKYWATKCAICCKQLLLPSLTAPLLQG